jgi:hypothetical protein
VGLPASARESSGEEQPRPPVDLVVPPDLDPEARITVAQQ